MANRTQVAPSATARPFFSLNAEYAITDDATHRNLIEDASCLLGGVMAIINTLAMEVGDKSTYLGLNPGEAARMAWSALHQLQMAKNIVDAVEVQA